MIGVHSVEEKVLVDSVWSEEEDMLVNAVQL